MRTRVVVGVVSLLAFAMTCCAPLVLFIQVWMQQNAGTFDRQRFEGVVDQVRELGLKPGESADLRLDDVYQPKSLRLRKANEELEEALAKEEIVKLRRGRLGYNDRRRQAKGGDRNARPRTRR